MSSETPATANVSRIGKYIAGPLFAALVFVFFRPEGLPVHATQVAAIASWMAIWWATEATHVAVTALLPLVTLPVLGISPMKETAASYAHPVIYLFLGGFVMAIAIQKSGLHERAALRVLKLVGVNARTIVAGLMVGAASISMWVSNSSTTLMMLPIAVSVVHVVRVSMGDLPGEQLRNFELSMFLGLAYGATTGGVATLVGTPPNAFLAGFMHSTYDIEIDFARWMIIGVPLTIVMLPIIWYVLVRAVYPVDFAASHRAKEHLETMLKELGPLSTIESRTAILFLALVAGWLLRKPIVMLTGAVELTDAAVAMTAAIAAFLIPRGEKGETLIVWDDTKNLPWGVLIMFGGGLALAGGMTSTGLTKWIGESLIPLGTIHIGILIVAVCALVIFLTELTSNTATTATFLPVMAALAIGMDSTPLILVVPVALAASFAFMLPVATPPNAIIFSSGHVPIRCMMLAGFLINLVGIVVLTVVALVLVPKVFG